MLRRNSAESTMLVRRISSDVGAWSHAHLDVAALPALLLEQRRSGKELCRGIRSRRAEMLAREGAQHRSEARHLRGHTTGRACGGITPTARGKGRGRFERSI